MKRSLGATPSQPGASPDERSGRNIDYERQDEQHQARSDESLAAVGTGFTELGSDICSNRVSTWLEDVPVHIECRSQDEGDSDSLTQRPTQSEHGGTDDAATTVRENRKPD